MTSSVSVVLPVGRSTSLPWWNVAPARTRATRWGAFTARHRDCAASMSLNAIARPAAREPGPLVTLLRCRTVANVDSIVILSRAPRRTADLGICVGDGVHDVVVRDGSASVGIERVGVSRPGLGLTREFRRF